MMLAHIPVATPVSAAVQAWQRLLHAESQQIWLPAGPTQLPFAHSAFDVHAVPSGLSWQVVPFGQ
jgi:hypothetical protein